MLEIKLNEALEQRLHELAQQSGQTPEEFMTVAVAAYMEDREDYLEAVEALKEREAGDGRTYSTEEVRRELGLDS